MLTIKAKDDFFVMRTKKKHWRGDTVFFMRDKRGAITAIWADPNVEVGSFGSAKERRALLRRHLKARAAAARRKARL